MVIIATLVAWIEIASSATDSLTTVDNYISILQLQGEQCDTIPQLFL